MHTRDQFIGCLWLCLQKKALFVQNCDLPKSKKQKTQKSVDSKITEPDVPICSKIFILRVFLVCLIDKLVVFETNLEATKLFLDAFWSSLNAS